MAIRSTEVPIIDPENWRVGMLTLMLRVAIVLGSVVYVPSVFLAMKAGMYALAAVDTVSLFAAIALLLWRRMPFAWRATGLCLIFYVLGVGLLVTVGPISQIYLFGFSIVSVLLLGRRVGLGAVVLSSATLLTVGLLGFASSEMVNPTRPSGFVGWLVSTLNFALVNTMLTMGIGTVLTAVENALKREHAVVHSLDRELTDRKQLEAERDRLLAKLQAQIERMPLAYLLTDKDLRYTHWNPEAERIFGFREVEILGKHPFDVIVPPESQSFVAGIFDEIQRGNMNAHGVAANCTGDGRTITCEWQNTPLFDEKGAFVGLMSLAQDITKRVTLEDQLRQAQKMEAVGQLAGGVAHDFNNLLTVIFGYSEALLALNDADGVIHESATEINEAAMRAAALTRQLLAFSRQTILQPKVLDLNPLVLGIGTMLRRLIGEDIIFTTILDPTIGRVRVDPGQLDQVLMNLAVNARDAMPHGGTLTIETANVELSEDYASVHPGCKPGPHVMLAVTDTGVGMTSEVMAHIFEPFYTTKSASVGTGLGLAMVFGIVQQSGGSIHVYSERNHGTTFKSYFPTVTEPLSLNPEPTDVVKLAGSESILLVEDEATVRKHALQNLQSRGYTVLAAADGEDAMRVLSTHTGVIDLLLTDVVMPHMSGPDLAQMLRVRFPSMQVLFMSGYTDDAVVRHGLLQAEVAFIQKPYTPQGLALKIRQVLDGKARIADKDEFSSMGHVM